MAAEELAAWESTLSPLEEGWGSPAPSPETLAPHLGVVWGIHGNKPAAVAGKLLLNLHCCWGRAGEVNCFKMDVTVAI